MCKSASLRGSGEEEKCSSQMCSKCSLKSSCTGAQTIRQRPRFIGAKTKRQVSISCSASAGVVQWYRLNKYNENRNKALEVKAGGRVSVPSPGAKLHISDLRVEDKGVYFCKVNNTWGCGTELQVSSKEAAERASSLASGNVSTNTHSRSPRIYQPREGSVQDQLEGRSHHRPGSAAGRVYCCHHATQANTGEDRARRLAVGPLLVRCHFIENKQTNTTHLFSLSLVYNK